MLHRHPFQQLFETFGKQPEAFAESVNRSAREKMKNALTKAVDAPGNCILLKAPRAGHGKTHLLNCVKNELDETHEFIPLQALAGSRIDMNTALDDTLRILLRALPDLDGLTNLDMLVRRLFAESLEPLVLRGEVPSNDSDLAVQALRNRPTETLNFHNPSAVTAQWAKENFELLAPRIALEISQRTGLSLRDVSFWVGALFRFAATPLDNPARLRSLTVQVLHEEGAEAVAHERLVALLGLLSTLQRVVIVADEVEGFSLDETAALRFASFIISLRHAVERVDFILSINKDIWEGAFVPRLSDGLVDRLTEITVSLEPLESAEKLAILESRSLGYSQKMIDILGEGALANHARGVIRQAAELWSNDFKKPEVEPTLVAENMHIVLTEVANATLDESVTFYPEVAIAAYESLYRNDTFKAEAIEKVVDDSDHSFGIDFNESPFVIDGSETIRSNFHDESSVVSDPSAEHVTELLKQFRERYGRATS